MDNIESHVANNKMLDFEYRSRFLIRSGRLETLHRLVKMKGVQKKAFVYFCLFRCTACLSPVSCSRSDNTSHITYTLSASKYFVHLAMDVVDRSACSSHAVRGRMLLA